MMGRKAARNMYRVVTPIKLEFSASVGFIHKEVDIRLQDSTVSQPSTIECEYSPLIKSVKLLNLTDIRFDLSQIYKTADKIRSL